MQEKQEFMMVPDEVHVQSVARRILKNYENNGPGWDFGERDASLVS
jgi:hypothetical protein